MTRSTGCCSSSATSSDRARKPRLRPPESDKMPVGFRARSASGAFGCSRRPRGSRKARRFGAAELRMPCRLGKLSRGFPAAALAFCLHLAAKVGLAAGRGNRPPPDAVAAQGRPPACAAASFDRQPIGCVGALSARASPAGWSRLSRAGSAPFGTGMFARNAGIARPCPGQLRKFATAFPRVSPDAAKRGRLAGMSAPPRRCISIRVVDTAHARGRCPKRTDSMNAITSSSSTGAWRRLKGARSGR